MIHNTADVSPSAKVGKNTKIWHQAQVREKAVIGDNCVIGKNVYIGSGVTIGSRVKIQNNASVYEGSSLEDGVFIGPNVVLANDNLPRAINPDGSLKTSKDWTQEETLVKYGASLGAGVLVLPGLTLGEFCLIGAGSVVTKDVAPHMLVLGNPAQKIGYVCKCGKRIKPGVKCQICEFEIENSGVQV